MDPQLNDRLKAIEDKLDINQKMLLKMHKTQRAGHYVRIAYWGFLILAGFGAFYFIKPVLGQLGETYGFTSGNQDSPSSTPSFSASGLMDQLKQFKELNQTK